MKNVDTQDIRGELDRFCKHQSIFIIVMMLINSFLCFGIITYYKMKEQALIGYAYVKDSDIGEKLADSFFNFRISSTNIAEGANAMEASGYGRNGFLYISRLNGEFTAFVLIVFLVIIILLVNVISCIRLKSKPAYVHVTELVEENKILKQKLESETRYNEKQYKKMHDFIENIAHQIKTPLATIVMKFDMLKEWLETQQESGIKHYIDMVNVGSDNAFKIKGFIKKLLDISRLESGKVIMAEDEVVIDSLLIESINSSECPADKITTNFNDDSMTIYADGGWLIECFVNIINNCAEAIKAYNDGKIYVDVSKNEKHNGNCVIIIADNGKGLSIEDFNMIFNRFETNAPAEEFRFGIGMNLSKLIIESHNGNIKAGNSEKHGGAEFKIELPSYKLKCKLTQDKTQ